jgi:D-alanine-D-alanine ligase
MRIGLAYDLKSTIPNRPDLPDDWEEEFDSPITVDAITQVLEGFGHEVIRLGNGRAFLEEVLRQPPDAVFNIAEGHGTSRNREARIPAVCEMLGIPCTGSDPLTMALALDKEQARRLAQDAGVPVPLGFVLQPPPGGYDGDGSEFAPILEEAGVHLPVILKPVLEGSSKGIRSTSRITDVAAFGPAVAQLWKQYQQPVLVEEFVDGDEVTVGVLGGDPPEVLGLMRIVPNDTTQPFVYSLEVKRDFRQQVRYECPAALPTPVLQELEASALAIWDAFQCRDVARIDFRIRDGVPYFLEINPLAGLNPESSDLVIQAGLLGMDYPTLIGRILTAAQSRWASSTTRPT